MKVDVQDKKLVYFVSAYQDGRECKVLYDGTLYQTEL